MREQFGVGTLLIHDGRVLLLKRADNDEFQPGEWGLPAGGIEKGEKENKAALREIFEEIGYRAKLEELRFVEKVDWQDDKEIIHFSIFRLDLEKGVEVRLDSSEHSESRWVKIEEIREIPRLIRNAYEVIESAYKKSN